MVVSLWFTMNRGFTISLSWHVSFRGVNSFEHTHFWLIIWPQLMEDIWWLVSFKMWRGIETPSLPTHPKRNGSVNLAPKTNHQADHQLFVIPDWKTLTHRIHVWHIYHYFPTFSWCFMVNAIYLPYMDPIGNWKLLICIEGELWNQHDGLKKNNTHNPFETSFCWKLKETELVNS